MSAEAKTEINPMFSLASSPALFRERWEDDAGKQRWK